MSTTWLALLVVAMSMEAFAAALGKGAVLERPGWMEVMRTVLIFGAIETATPLVGWLLGAAAARHLNPWQHWIAFGLLFVLGMRMVRAGWAGPPEAPADKARSHSFRMVAVAAFAAGVDGMAAGACLAFLEVAILPAALAIGLTTAVMVTVGVMSGRRVGAAAGRRAVIAGGVTVLCIASLTLAAHFGGQA